MFQPVDVVHLDLLQHHVAQVEYVIVRQGIQVKNAQAARQDIISLDLNATVRFFIPNPIYE